MSCSKERDPARHVMLYEPRTEGHHLGWLQFITEDLLGDGWRITLALDTSSTALAKARDQLGALLERVQVISARSGDFASPRRQSNAAAVGACFAQAGASLAFLDTFDEIASTTLRRAAWHQWPPRNLRGRLGGIYLRPRFLATRRGSLNEWLKRRGFLRLLHNGWFSHVMFLDPFLWQEQKTLHPSAPFYFLPDPHPDNFADDRGAARRALQLPEDAPVFLFYGGGYRRKGLPIAVEAILALSNEPPVWLLFAGHAPEDAVTRRGLDALRQQRRALIQERYVTVEEEKQMFAACDFVLLPYLQHFGSSGVLARAAAAGKPVIASDEELVGRLVRQYGLGLLFESGSASALREAMQQMLAAPPERRAQWSCAAATFAATCNRAAFRVALLGAFNDALRRLA